MGSLGLCTSTITLALSLPGQDVTLGRAHPRILCCDLDFSFLSDLWIFSWSIQADTPPIAKQQVVTMHSRYTEPVPSLSWLSITAAGKACFSYVPVSDVDSGTEKLHLCSPSHIAFEQRPALSPEPNLPSPAWSIAPDMHTQSTHFGTYSHLCMHM